MPAYHDAATTVHAMHAQTSVHRTAIAKPAGVHGKKTSATKPSKPATRKTISVTIRPGDTVYALARTHHSSVAAIAKANPGLNFQRLIPGTQIKMPTPSPVSAPKAAKPAPKSAPKKPAKPTTQAPKPSAPAKKTYAPKPTHVPRYAGTKAAKGYASNLVAQGDKDRATLAKADLPTRDEIKKIVVETAKRYDVNPKLALAIAYQESGWAQHQVSVCDAVGTMQVMRTSGTWAGNISNREYNLMQARDNIEAGVVILRYLTEHASSQDQAIGAYYQGLGGMRKYGPYPDTSRYIASVNAHMQNLP